MAMPQIETGYLMGTLNKCFCRAKGEEPELGKSIPAQMGGHVHSERPGMIQRAQERETPREPGQKRTPEVSQRGFSSSVVVQNVHLYCI